MKELQNLNGIHFLPIGGCSEIGMNLYAYICDNQWLLVDMGIGFSNDFGRSLVLPDISILNNKNVKALILTHAHEDHIGAIPHLWEKIRCPIYATNFTAEMVMHKAFEYQIEKDLMIIRSEIGHPFDIGAFNIEFINVAHSTAEACALAIKTKDGTIVHSGDWRIDENPVLGAKTDEEKFKRLGDEGVLAFVCDSTNVFKEDQSSSERSVRENLIQIVQKYHGRKVAITCFASNVARIETCYKAACATGRKMVVVGRSLKRIEKVARAAGYFSDLPAFYTENDLKNFKDHEVLLICTGSQGERNSALYKIAYDMHTDVQLSHPDVLLFSSRIIPGNEKTVVSLQNELIKKGVTVINDHHYDIHASGHPCVADLKRVYSLLRPEIVIPMHGDARNLQRQMEVANSCGIQKTILPEDGSLIKIDPQGATKVCNIPSKILALEGNRLVPNESHIFKQREELSNNGVLFISVKNTPKELRVVDMTALGVYDDEAYIYDDIASAIQLGYTGRSRNQDKKWLERNIIKTAQKTIARTTGARPNIMVHFV